MNVDKTTLGLFLPTDPRWVNIAEMNLADILIDHAWCEQKAASSCISLIINYWDFPQVIETLNPVVVEEWAHFRMVLQEMKLRGITLAKPRKDQYVIELLKLERAGNKREQQLMDKLLINALIEARSAERFKLLSIHISELALRDFYHQLMISEASHYRSFITLAKSVMPAEVVDQRWKELLQQELLILQNIGVREGAFH